MKQLAKDDPERLYVLSDGKQRKSYLHVEDCVEGRLLGCMATDELIQIFNLGIDEICRMLIADPKYPLAAERSIKEAVELALDWLDAK